MQPAIIVPQPNICVNLRRGCKRYALGLCDCPAECDLITHPEHFQQAEKKEERVAA